VALSDADVAKAINDPNVHAVVIASTSNTHKQHALNALAAGKHVFCEKPFAPNSADTIECVNAGRRAGLVTYCGFQRRWDITHGSVFEEAAAGSVGVIEQVRISSRDAATHNDPSYLAKSGNIFFDSLIHDFDAARHIVGEQPCEVYCQGGAFYDALKAIGQLDTVVVVLRFPSGAIATLDNNRRAMYGYDQRLEVFGSQGMVQAENPLRTTVTLSTGDGHLSDREEENGINRYMSAYHLEISHFVDVLRGEAKLPVVSPQEIIDAHVIAEAAIESQKTGKRVRL